MTAHRHRLLSEIGLWIAALVAPVAAAQQAPGDNPPTVTADLLETKIAETQTAADLAEETKTRLLSLYREALSNLDQADADRASAKAFRVAVQTAPIEAQPICEDTDESNVADPTETLPVDGSTSLSGQPADMVHIRVETA
jgi:potassium efflux system protein